jgi:hypothetical protein
VDRPYISAGGLFRSFLHKEQQKDFLVVPHAAEPLLSKIALAEEKYQEKKEREVDRRDGIKQQRKERLLGGLCRTRKERKDE